MVSVVQAALDQPPVTFQERRPPAHLVTAGRLDPEDPGAEVGKDPGGEDAGWPGQIDNHDAVERAVAGRRGRRHAGGAW